MKKNGWKNRMGLSVWVAAIFAVQAGVVSAGPSEDWQLLPLRTQAAKDAGHVGGDGFQWIFGLGFAPADTNRVYGLVDVGRVWRSDDAGHNWQPASGGFLASGGFGMMIDPFNGIYHLCPFHQMYICSTVFPRAYQPV